MGGALQVSCIFSEIFCIRWSSCVQDICHSVFVIRSFINVFVSSLIWSEFSSKNSVLNFSIFVGGMGFKILGGLSIVGVICRANSVLGGMCNDIGE